MGLIDYWKLHKAHKTDQIERAESVLPEHDLQIAILDRAIRDFKGNAIQTGDIAYQERNTRLAQKDASDWFNSDETEMFSFLGICHSLDIEPSYIVNEFLLKNRAISRWSTQGRKKNKYFKDN